MGATVIIGRAVGGNRMDDAGKAVGNTVTLFMVLAAVLMAVLLCLARPIVILIGTPEEAVAETVQYLVICFLGIPFITAYNIISAIFRGMGDSKSPMYFIAIACAANIGLDYLFLGAWKMGAAGAALGTTLSQTISVVISLAVILRKNTGLSLKHSDFRPDRMMMGQILKIGFPVAVQDGCIQIAFLLITVIANHRGLDDATAVGIVEKIISALFIVPFSMLATVSALSAQNIGAGKHKRASQTLRYATILTTAYGIVITILMELAVQPVMQLFTPDAAVVALGCQYMRGYIIDTIFAGIHFSFSGYFAAYGKSYIGFLHNMAAIVLLRVPGSYLASRMFPETLFPMGLAAPAGSLLSVVICLGAFFWMKRRGTIECA
ncbi:MATE family efflux transporter [Ruminococcus sp.]